ncbi:hypothetical protein REPUB_Repub05bG0030300 [Reevesia pubescens]
MWNCISNRADYIHDLGNNLESLEYEMERLKRKIEDVEASLNREENEWFQRTHEVTDWPEREHQLEETAEKIIQKGKEELQKKCLGGCRLNDCCTNNQIGKKVSETLKTVAELITGANFDAKLDEVWRWLEDPSVGIIGIYGMGGVGKTTLLKMVNNKFLDTSHSSHLVTWIVVSKDAEVE